MTKNTTDELDEILDYAEIFYNDSKWEEREKINPTYSELKARLEALISNREKLARIGELETTKKRATQHCAFKIDQYSSDLDTEDVRLAVPNKKIDERITTLRKELDGEQSNVKESE